MQLTMIRFYVLAVAIILIHCNTPQEPVQESDNNLSLLKDSLSSTEISRIKESGPLLLTDFTSLEELRTVVELQYAEDLAKEKDSPPGEPQVCLTNRCRGRVVKSVLKQGVSEGDFNRAKSGGFWSRVHLVLKSPFALINGNDLVRVEILGRRRYTMFGKADVAFFDLAEAMVKNIIDDDLIYMPPEDLSEKGYLNTFNHVIAQSFMTSLYSEEIADYVADVHERHTMPELITGSFTTAQLVDLEKGPVDNYVDMINNEWGQELGKELREKYNICKNTYWTPDLLASYLNDIQSYHSWVFQIGFTPFRVDDEIVVYFAGKINTVKKDIARLRKFY